MTYGDNLYQKRTDEMVERIKVALALPTPAEQFDVGDPDFFDPWELFPSVYGTYDAAFDQMAIDVLTDLRDEKYRRRDLASYIFREMLCVAELCNYGTSPRVCWAEPEFKACLPALIDAWKAYYLASWGGEYWSEYAA